MPLAPTSTRVEKKSWRTLWIEQKFAKWWENVFSVSHKRSQYVNSDFHGQECSPEINETVWARNWDGWRDYVRFRCRMIGTWGRSRGGAKSRGPAGCGYWIILKKCKVVQAEGWLEFTWKDGLLSKKKVSERNSGRFRFKRQLLHNSLSLVSAPWKEFLGPHLSVTNIWECPCKLW